MRTVSFAVDSIPPYKQSPADKTERKHQAERTHALRHEAKESIAGSDILVNSCAVSIRYSRSKGKADGANIIGGLLDGLQGIAFKNDKQVVEISYTEFNGAKDWFQVTITDLTRGR